MTKCNTCIPDDGNDCEICSDEVQPPCCENCTNHDCNLSNESLNEAKKLRILDIGRIMMMKCSSKEHGCLSYPLAHAYLNGDVIKELERCKRQESLLDKNSKQYCFEMAIDYVINLLKTGVPK